MVRKHYLALVVLALGLMGSARADQGVHLATGFTDFTAWSLYGSATAANTTPGNGFTYSDQKLTSPGVGGSGGAGFAPDAITLDFNQAFAFDFHFFIPAGTVLRGDGLTFTLASAPGLGGAGSGLGYSGLQDSVAFAVDTFHFSGDPVSPSIQILQNGSVAPLAATETGLGDGIRDLTFQFRATVAYSPSGNNDETGTLTGSILHANLGTFSVTAPVNLSGLGAAVLDPNTSELMGHTVFYGFTASNGLADDGHFITSAVPVPEPSTYAMLMAGMAMLCFVARRRLQRSRRPD